MSRRVIKERSRLEKELATARRTSSEQSRRSVAATHRAEKLERERRKLLVEIARGRADEKEADKLAAEIARAHAEARDARERSEVAHEAARGTERALKHHIATNLEVFLREAEKLTDAAVKERERVVAAMEKARATEAEARREWATLKNAAQANRMKIGSLGVETFDRRTIDSIANAERPEPSLVRAARKTLIEDPSVPEAVRDLYTGPKPKPAPEPTGSLVEVF